MVVVVFSDVHADARALEQVASFLEDRRFAGLFGDIECIVSLGDLLGRGCAPAETLAAMERLKKEYRVISLLGNHDHAFVHGIPVSGSDVASIRAHAPLAGSPLLDGIADLPAEAVIDRTLFVHGGPLRLGDALTDQPFWQRLSERPGPSLSGYHYTPEMAFAELERRGLRHLCCGHQHTPICCLKEGGRIVNRQIRYEDGVPASDTVALDRPAILRVGACMGPHPEFAVTDSEQFSFLRL